MTTTAVGERRNLDRVWYRLSRWHCGGIQAVTKHDLAAWCDLRPREVERAVQELRREGRPIGSSCGKGSPMGYYVAETVEELDAVIGQLDDRVRTQVMTLHGLRRARHEMLRRRQVEPGGQVRMFPLQGAPG